MVHSHRSVRLGDPRQLNRDVLQPDARQGQPGKRPEVVAKKVHGCGTVELRALAEVYLPLEHVAEVIDYRVERAVRSGGHRGPLVGRIDLERHLREELLGGQPRGIEGHLGGGSDRHPALLATDPVLDDVALATRGTHAHSEAGHGVIPFDMVGLASG